MATKKAIAVADEPAIAGPLFTVEQANRALVFVRRVVSDIVVRYRELVELRCLESELEVAPCATTEQEALQGRIARCVAALARAHGELLDVGCVLRDWRTGLIDFPAARNGRRVWLCWRLGEPHVTYWHDLRAGFAGRREL